MRVTSGFIAGIYIFNIGLPCKTQQIKKTSALRMFKRGLGIARCSITLSQVGQQAILRDKLWSIKWLHRNLFEMLDLQFVSERCFIYSPSRLHYKVNNNKKVVATDLSYRKENKMVEEMYILKAVKRTMVKG